MNAKGGHPCALEINNALNFRNYMENLLIGTNQSRTSGILIGDMPPEYDYNNTSSFSVTFEEQDIKLPLDKFGPILYLQIRYHIDEEMYEYQR